MKTVRLNLVQLEDIEALVEGVPLPQVRMQRMARLVREAYDQGATLTTTQLAIMTGMSSSAISTQFSSYMKKSGEVLPLRGIVEDCSSAISHKALIVKEHLAGKSTSEIARATAHTPKSVERYIRRFEQVRELVTYLEKDPDPDIIARILSCSSHLVRKYLELLPE